MITRTVILTIIAILTTLHISCTQADYYDQITKFCTVVPIGTQLPVLNACQSYVKCHLYGYFNYTCYNGEYFDKDAQQCRPPSTVKCYAELLPCERSNASLVPNPDNCNGYISCRDNAEINRGTCLDGLHFNSTSQSCIKGNCSKVDFNDVTNICNALPEDLIFGDFEQCNIWHKCTGGKLVSGTCDHDMVLNIEKGKCVPIDKYDKSCIRFRKNHECDFPGQFRNDEHICSVFSYCWGKYEDLFQCGGHDYFEASTGLCVDRQMATPQATCNRCEYASTQWVNAVDPDCEKYLICQDGLPVAERSCGPNRYFDEQRQACIVGVKNLEEYRQRNGACRLPR